MRKALEQRGLAVVVAAGSRSDALAQDKRLKVPVRPDVALADADAADYSAIVFVGGWGASSYQYAFEGTYANAFYRPDGAVDRRREPADQRLRGAGQARGWHLSRGDGAGVGARGRREPAEGPHGRRMGGRRSRVRAGWDRVPGVRVPTRAQLEENGATMILSAAVGNPLSSHDDVWVDGRIITAENPAAAAATGKTLAAVLLGK